MAVGMGDTGVLINRQVVSLIADDDGFFEFREKHDATDRRSGGGDEQSVVPARVQAGDGGRGEAPEAVGFQPLAASGGSKVSADSGPELDHRYSLNESVAGG